jgi:hypothetical protein
MRASPRVSFELPSTEATSWKGDLDPFLIDPRPAWWMSHGFEELLDLAATAGAFEPPRHFAILDHDQGRHVLDREAFDELGMLVAVDPPHRERPMVLPPLQHLSEEGLNPS